MDTLATSQFWIGLLTIIWVNIIVSGDNAVVIALAARALPPEQQKKAVFWGSAAAVALRIVLTLVASTLLALPYLQIVGGCLLLWIGVQLLGDEAEGDNAADHHPGSLTSAVRTILIADVIMSLDNVIAVAAAAKGDTLLLILGLAISIPLVVFGSTLTIRLMARFPAIVTVGAALIGWVGGETVAGDAVLRDLLAGNGWVHYAGAAMGAALVVVLGKALRARATREQAA